MTSLGQYAIGGVIQCQKIIAKEADIPGTGGGGSDLDISSITLNSKWKIYLDTNSNFILENEVQNVISLSGNAHTGKITLFDFNLNDLANVDTNNVQNGSVMFYDNLTSGYEFTDTLRFLKATQEWNIQNVPLTFTGGDLKILQDAVDLNKNIYIGGIQRDNATADGNSICIGALAGAQLQKKKCIAIGYGAGSNGQGNSPIFQQFEGNSIAIGKTAGVNQEHDCIAIGTDAGQVNQNSNSLCFGTQSGFRNLNINSLAIGHNAGQLDLCFGSIAIGFNSAKDNCDEYAVHIGSYAGENNSEAYTVGIGYKANNLQAKLNSIAIGKEAGLNFLKKNSIAIGTSSGKNNSGENCIYIGEAAGLDGGNFNNVIVLNAESADLDPTGNNKCYINPIFPATGTNILQYNATTKEVTYQKTVSDIDIANSLTLNQSTGVSGEVLISQGAAAPIYAPLPTPSSSYPALNCAFFSLIGNVASPATGGEILVNGFYTEIRSVGTDITNNDNGTFTINQTGIYQIIYSMEMISRDVLSNSARCRLKMRAGGTGGTLTQIGECKFFGGSAVTFVPFRINYLNQFTANDIIELYAVNNTYSYTIEGGGQNVRTGVSFVRLG
mgnify:FL=1